MVAKINLIIKTGIKDSKRLEKFHGISLPANISIYRIGSPAAW